MQLFFSFYSMRNEISEKPQLDRMDRITSRQIEVLSIKQALTIKQDITNGLQDYQSK